MLLRTAALPGTLLLVSLACSSSGGQADGGTDTDDGGTDTGTQTEGCEPGSLSWAVGIGGDEYVDGNYWFTAEEVSNVVAVPNGAVVVAGTFMNEAVFDPGGPNQTLLSAADYSDRDIFFARYEADGSLAWAKRAGGAPAPDFGDFVTGMGAFSDGSFVASGYFLNEAVFGAGEPNETVLEPTWVYSGVFHARFKADGTLDWAKNLPHHVTCWPSSIGQPCLISILTTGLFAVSSTFGPTSVFGEGEPNETALVATPYPDDPLNGDDLFVAVFHGDGSLAWAVAAGGASGEAVHDIAACPVPAISPS
jgi:hypothetical protein